MQEESIYNLIPKEYATPPKQPLYRSKFHHSVPPTGSTFGHHTTSVPKVSNLSGDFIETRGGHAPKAYGATFGKPMGASKAETTNFLKRNSPKTENGFLPEISGSVKYDRTKKKPAIPKKDERPIMGLFTTKNYVLANAVEAQLAQPKVVEQPIVWTTKKEYGKVPKYLEKIKEQTRREYEHIKALQQMEQEQQHADKFMLSEEEIKELREGLKNKWDIVNKEYQLYTHKILDTIGLRRKKENCEKELMQIERDLEKLNKGFILVDTAH